MPNPPDCIDHLGERYLRLEVVVDVLRTEARRHERLADSWRGVGVTERRAGQWIRASECHKLADYFAAEYAPPEPDDDHHAGVRGALARRGA